jgi:hypothetical protein
MATTTTNFGWDIPQSTDLVKDGATAIAALGQDIDTALIDLKGGTTGQVLAKASNTDLDYSWVAQDDSNAIQNAIVDAKGDLISASAADTPARLAVGTNGQILTVDSTTGTGLKWATASSASGPAFLAYVGSTQSVSQSTETKVAYNTEEFDTDNAFNNTTYVFTPQTAGYYQVNITCYMDQAESGRGFGILKKNGSNYLRFGDLVSTDFTCSGSTIVYMNGSTDYLDVWVYMDSATSRSVHPQLNFSQFNAVWIRS